MDTYFAKRWASLLELNPLLFTEWLIVEIGAKFKNKRCYPADSVDPDHLQHLLQLIYLHTADILEYNKPVITLTGKRPETEQYQFPNCPLLNVTIHFNAKYFRPILK